MKDYINEKTLKYITRVLFFIPGVVGCYYGIYLFIGTLESIGREEYIYYSGAIDWFVVCGIGLIGIPIGLISIVATIIGLIYVGRLLYRNIPKFYRSVVKLWKWAFANN